MKRKPIIEVKFNNPFKKELKPLYQPDFNYAGHDFTILDPFAAIGTKKSFTWERNTIYAQALNNITLNVDHQDLTAITDGISEAYEKKDYQRMQLLNLTLKGRMKLKGYERSYIDLGVACCLIDDEIHQDNEKDNLKRDLIKQYETLRGFFLHVAYRCLSPMDKLLSISELMDYFQDPNYQEADATFQALIYDHLK